MLLDSLITENDRKEQYSIAFVSAVAAKAGYTTSYHKVDRDSTDIIVHAGGPRRPSLALQLKASSVCVWRGEQLPFILKRKNYDDLIIDRITPLLLVVLEMPTEEDDWFRWTENELVLRKCAWWTSIKGHPPIEKESKTVFLSKEQPFTPDTLKALMEQARRGEL